MLRRTRIAILLLLLAAPAMACVGKSLVIGTDSSPESKAVAQILAILINERTGTTVEITDYSGYDALIKEMTQGDVDLALDYAGRALKHEGASVPPSSGEALEKAKELYMEKHNLVWLTPFGFAEPGQPASLAATIAQKHALKKFPALPRLIAKTNDLLQPETLKTVVLADNQSKAARDFLKKNKLI